MTEEAPQTFESLLPDGCIDLSGDGGVMKKVVKEGVADATPGGGDTVEVHYTGTLFGGDRHDEKFDSSRDRNDPFSFQLKGGQVIKGWDTCVASMKKGEVCEVFLKPGYGYGEGGSGSIPPNANLKFEIELLKWGGEDISPDKDKSIEKSKIKDGEGYTNPNDGANVDIVVKGFYQDNVFDERSVQLEVGDGDDYDLPEGVEIALKKMHKGEVARITLASKFGFGSEGCKKFGIPGHSELVYEIELKDFEKVKEGWEMDVNEKLSQSDLAKQKGTAYLSKGKLKQALSSYKRCIDYLEWDNDFQKEDQDKQDQRKQLLLAARLNSALVHQKLGNYTDCTNQCDEAIKLDSNSEKGYFRRGQAKFSLRDFDDAKLDFQEVLRIDVNNKAAAKHVALCIQNVRAEKEKQKKTFFGMFDKFASKDEQLKPSGETNTEQVANGGDATTES